MTFAASPIDPVTARWTEALFNLAERQGALLAVGGDVERLGAELRSPAVRDFLLGSKRGTAERLARLDGVASTFHPLTKNFLRLAFDRRREAILLRVAEAFRRRTMEASGAVDGIVEAPRPLDSTELARLATTLGARLDRQVRLESRVVPELVAGVRVFVGARMIDASVSGRLDALRRRMEETPLPAGA